MTTVFSENIMGIIGMGNRNIGKYINDLGRGVELAENNRMQSWQLTVVQVSY